MTQEVNDDINATILEAEETILRIAEELGRMKSAAEQLDRGRPAFAIAAGCGRETW